MKKIFSIIIIMLICSQSYGQKPRARDLGVLYHAKFQTKFERTLLER